MVHITYCTLCLVTDTKIYKMSSDMYNTYNELIQTQNKMSINQMHACYECAHLLQKYREFKAKCSSAYNLLQLYTDDFKITEENIKSIDRKQNNLESKLTKNYKSLYYIHIIEKDEKSNHNVKKSNFHENFRESNLKTESVVNCKEKEQVTDENLNYNATLLLHLDYSMLNVPENPLQIDEKQIKEEVEELMILVDNEQANITASNIEVMKFDLHNEELNNDTTENNNETLKIEFEMENYGRRDIEKNYKCTVNSSEEDDSVSFSNDVRDNIDIKDDVDDSDNTLDTDSDDEGNKNNDDHDDEESDELNKLLDKYSPTERVNVKMENKLLISLLQKRKLKIQSDIKKVLAKRRKKIKEVTAKMKNSIDDIIKIKCLNKNNMNRTRNRKSLGVDRSLYENYATVIELTPEDALREVLLRKEKTNYKTCKYKCDLCFRGYNLEITYQTHMKKHSLEEGPIKCDICQMRFATKRALQGHMKSCHTYKFICQRCPYVSFSTTQSKAHVLLHKGKQYSCTECGEKFRYSHSVLSHYRLRHKLEFVCDLCGNAYAAEKGILAHKRRTHKKEKNEFQGPKCEDCNVHFSNERAWKRHFVLCTKHTVSNGCIICGEVFDDLNGLREHSKQHERRMSYSLTHKKIHTDKEKVLGPCEYCNAPLNSEKHYSSHMLQYHPDTEVAEAIRGKNNECVCEICGAMFRKEFALRIHQRTHSSDKPFSCDECGKSFKSAQWLRTHQTTHTKVFPYQCNICNKAFGTKACLNRHVKSHAERPYKCTNCEKSFIFLCDMKNHVKYVHNKMPWPKRDRSKRNLKAKELLE